MKLLVDENLAPELAEQLADLFPGSVRVTFAGLGSTSDAIIWAYAGANQFTSLTKDADFVNLSLALGRRQKWFCFKLETVPLRGLSASSGPTPFASRNLTMTAIAVCFS